MLLGALLRFRWRFVVKPSRGAVAGLVGAGDVVVSFFFFFFFAKVKFKDLPAFPLYLNVFC